MSDKHWTDEGVQAGLLPQIWADWAKTVTCARCGHPSDDTWFDREVCPEPCGMMHTRCKGCGTDADGCHWDER